MTPEEKQNAINEINRKGCEIMSREELINAVVYLIEDCDRLRAELDKIKGIIR